MKKQKKNLVLNILSYILIGIVFTISLVGIITRFNKGTVYLFNIRADVVLSGSMSTKNENHLDFLNGHDDQIQKMDLVFSKKVDSDNDLNVYDIVLYNNPLLGTTMHRIVDKTIKSNETFYLNYPTFLTFAGQSVIQMNDWTSGVTTNSIGYDAFEVILYSQFDNVDNYTFSDGFKEYQKIVNTERIDNYYKHTVTARDLSSRPRKFVFNHKHEFDYSKDYLLSVTLNASYGQITATSNNFKKVEENRYEYIAHTSYNYEIRGDALKDSDGTEFTKSDIYSKVTFVIPFAGHFVRFITSIFGIFLMIGLGFIVIGVNFILERDKNKKQKIEKEKAENNEEK